MLSRCLQLRLRSTPAAAASTVTSAAGGTTVLSRNDIAFATSQSMLELTAKWRAAHSSLEHCQEKKSIANNKQGHRTTSGGGTSSTGCCAVLGGVVVPPSADICVAFWQKVTECARFAPLYTVAQSLPDILLLSRASDLCDSDDHNGARSINPSSWPQSMQNLCNRGAKDVLAIFLQRLKEEQQRDDCYSSSCCCCGVQTAKEVVLLVLPPLQQVYEGVVLRHQRCESALRQHQQPSKLPIDFKKTMMQDEDGDAVRTLVGQVVAAVAFFVVRRAPLWGGGGGQPPASSPSSSSSSSWQQCPKTLRKFLQWTVAVGVRNKRRILLGHPQQPHPKGMASVHASSISASSWELGGDLPLSLQLPRCSVPGRVSGGGGVSSNNKGSSGEHQQQQQVFLSPSSVQWCSDTLCELINTLPAPSTSATSPPQLARMAGGGEADLQRLFTLMCRLHDYAEYARRNHHSCPQQQDLSRGGAVRCVRPLRRLSVAALGSGCSLLLTSDAPPLSYASVEAHNESVRTRQMLRKVRAWLLRELLPATTEAADGTTKITCGYPLRRLSAFLDDVPTIKACPSSGSRHTRPSAGGAGTAMGGGVFEEDEEQELFAQLKRSAGELFATSKRTTRNPSSSSSTQDMMGSNGGRRKSDAELVGLLWDECADCASRIAAAQAARDDAVPKVVALVNVAVFLLIATSSESPIDFHFEEGGEIADDVLGGGQQKSQRRLNGRKEALQSHQHSLCKQFLGFADEAVRRNTSSMAAFNMAHKAMMSSHRRRTQDEASGALAGSASGGVGLSAWLLPIRLRLLSYHLAAYDSQQRATNNPGHRRSEDLDGDGGDDDDDCLPPFVGDAGIPPRLLQTVASVACGVSPLEWRSCPTPILMATAAELFSLLSTSTTPATRHRTGNQEQETSSAASSGGGGRLAERLRVCSSNLFPSDGGAGVGGGGGGYAASGPPNAMRRRRFDEDCAMLLRHLPQTLLTEIQRRVNERTTTNCSDEDDDVGSSGGGKQQKLSVAPNFNYAVQFSDVVCLLKRVFANVGNGSSSSSGDVSSRHTTGADAEDGSSFDYEYMNVGSVSRNDIDEVDRDRHHQDARQLEDDDEELEVMAEVNAVIRDAILGWAHALRHEGGFANDMPMLKLCRDVITHATATTAEREVNGGGCSVGGLCRSAGIGSSSSSSGALSSSSFDAVADHLELHEFCVEHIQRLQKLRSSKQEVHNKSAQHRQQKKGLKSSSSSANKASRVDAAPPPKPSPEHKRFFEEEAQRKQKELESENAAKKAKRAAAKLLKQKAEEDKGAPPKPPPEDVFRYLLSVPSADVARLTGSASSTSSGIGGGNGSVALDEQTALKILSLHPPTTPASTPNQVGRGKRSSSIDAADNMFGADEADDGTHDSKFVRIRRRIVSKSAAGVKSVRVIKRMIRQHRDQVFSSSATAAGGGAGEQSFHHNRTNDRMFKGKGGATTTRRQKEFYRSGGAGTTNRENDFHPGGSQRHQRHSSTPPKPKAKPQQLSKQPTVDVVKRAFADAAVLVHPDSTAIRSEQDAASRFRLLLAARNSILRKLRGSSSSDGK